MVSLRKLTYWNKIKLKHSPGVVYIEKNIHENLITGIVLNITRKRRETFNGRLDVNYLGTKRSYN